MAIYAKVENNIVTNMIVADKEFIDLYFPNELYLECMPGAWGGRVYDDNGKVDPTIKAIRHNYPDIGSTYDPEKDIFYPPHPNDGTASWILNENFIWERPIPRPSNDAPYVWQETTQSWILDPHAIPVTVI
jgi:hypothetical protein